MKKLLATLTVATVAVGAFGQGKLSFENNINQLIYFTTDTTKLMAADAGKTVNGFALAGSTLSSTSVSAGAGSIASLAGSPSFTIALFAGTSAGSLSQVATTTMGDSNSGGLINALNVQFPTFAAGTTVFMNLEVFDSRATSTANAWLTVNPANPTGSLSMYAGQSGVFSAIAQNSVYSPMWTPGGTVQSTMPVGSTIVPKDYAGYAGYFGSIPVSAAVVPEPGTLALAGLGLVSLLALRRRS
jgi:hypothetical protein